MGFSKPSVLLDWINDDSAAKYTIPSSAAQLAGHINDTNADEKIFNFCWWRLSAWIEFLDNTFDNSGNNINAPNSTTITETVAPAASTVALDAGGIKSWDASSNAIFSVTEPGVVTIGYNANDIISLTAGVLSVATATAADLVKLHALTPSAADLNLLLGAVGNGLAVADITKLAGIDSSAAEINLLHSVSGLIQADFTKLAAINSSAAELNLLYNVSGLVQADFTKLAALTPSAADINPLLGASGNGLAVADITKLAGIDSSAAELNLLNSVAGLVKADFTKLAAIDSSAINIDAMVSGGLLAVDGISSYNITSNIGVTDKPGLIKWDYTGINMSDPRNPSVSLFHLKSQNRSAGTTDGTSVGKLVDNSADFVTDGVAEDDFVYNATDNTGALVTHVDDLHNLSIDTDIFISGEAYIIMSLHTGDMHIGSNTKYINYDSNTEVITAAGSFVGQAALKTDTEEETADVATGNALTATFSSIGEYGFYPQVKFETNTTGVEIVLDDGAGGGAGPTAYQPISILISHTSGSNRNIYAQIRYATASGEICWVFILKDKITKKYIRMHKCPDHPAISCHDVEAVHHPFYGNYDPEKHNMFCIPLNKTERAEVEDLREWKNELPGLTFLEAIKKYYDINENPKSAKWPDIPVTIGLDRKGKVMKAKIPKRDYIKQAELVKKK